MEFDEVFTFEHLYDSFEKCCKGVNWKTSTKNYVIRSIQNVAKTYIELQRNTYKARAFAKFMVCERGKTRLIKALHIVDRVVQKCYCDYFLVPLLQKTLIYDNGACMKGKGLSFSSQRLKAHLQSYYRQNGHSNTGYILTFDFSKFFESIDHQILLQKARKVIKDDRLFYLYKYFVDCFENGVGLGLGSQISQVSALFFASSLDHYIKEKLQMRFYARYMDDGYIISNSRDELVKCKKHLIEGAEKLKLKINVKKTRIWKIEKGFMFVNRHWHLTPKGCVKLKPSHSTLLRLRKRHRKLVTMEDVDAIKRYEGSVNGFLKQFNNRRLNDYVYN